MSNEKEELETVSLKIPFVSEEIIMIKRDYVNIIKFLLFILGYLITSLFHLMNMMEEINGEFYNHFIGLSLIESIPEGFLVGLIFTFFKSRK